MTAGSPVRPLSAASELGPAWKQPAREGRSLLTSSERPAMGSLCRYPMGKLSVQRSGQDAAGASPSNEESLRGRRLAWRPTRREARRSKNRRRLRAAGLGREKDTAGPRGKAVQGRSECRSLGLPCMPQSSSQKRSPVYRTGGTNGRARSLLREQSSDRAAWRYLVDPASSHMLVSKIKPCMSKYKLLYTVKLRMAH